MAFTTKLVNYPTAIAGLGLAIASLGLVWSQHVTHSTGLQYLGALIAAALVLPLLLKFSYRPSLLVKELRHPVAGAMLPVVTMSIMVMAKSLAVVQLEWAVALGFGAFSLQLLLLLSFAYYRSQYLVLEHFIPCWFIPPIGLALWLVVSPIALSTPLIKIILYGSLLAYALLLPLVIYRLKAAPLALEQRPFLAILATPASLILLAYLVTTPKLNPAFVYSLAALAILMTLSVYLLLALLLLKLPFSPTYAAFTFPLVVSSSALFQLGLFMQNRIEAGSLGQGLIKSLAYLELAVASLMVVYVAVRYLRHYWPQRH